MTCQKANQQAARAINGSLRSLWACGGLTGKTVRRFEQVLVWRQVNQTACCRHWNWKI